MRGKAVQGWDGGSREEVQTNTGWWDGVVESGCNSIRGGGIGLVAWRCKAIRCGGMGLVAGRILLESRDKVTRSVEDI